MYGPIQALTGFILHTTTAQSKTNLCRMSSVATDTCSQHRHGS